MFILLRCVLLKKYLQYTANNMYSDVNSSNLKLGYISEFVVQLTYFDYFLDSFYIISACLNEIY